MNPTPFNSKTTPWRVQVPGRYFPDGKRKAKYFETKEAAEKFSSNLKKFGAAALELPAPKEETDRFGALVQMALSKLGNDPEQLFAAISHFEKTRLNVTAATLREAVEQFQAIRKNQVSATTWQNDRQRLLKLFNPFENRQMAEITETDLRRWFDELGRKINTRSVHKSVKRFFRWAREYNLVAVNPMLSIKPIHSFGVNNEIYSPKSFERMLRIAAGLEPARPGEAPTDEFKDLLPWFILSGFLGLRSCEAFREKSSEQAIRWDDLYFARGFVHIRHAVAKRTKRKNDERYISRPHALAAAQSWLALVPRNSEFIVPSIERTIGELKIRFTARSGIKFVENGLRNSFASYYLRTTGEDGVGKLSLEMGNSETVCKAHYIQTLKPEAGNAWFGIRPAAENVIPMPAAAA